MTEIWKDIPGYEGYYQVSDMGNVKSVARKSLNKKGILIQRTNGKKINPKNDHGYKSVTISKNGKSKTYMVHRLVLLTFNGMSELECNHINGIKSDNQLSNLEYCTRKENAIHSYKLGLQVPIKGERINVSKLTASTVINIRENKYNLTQYEFAALLEVDQSTISNIKTRKIWSHI